LVAVGVIGGPVSKAVSVVSGGEVERGAGADAGTAAAAAGLEVPLTCSVCAWRFPIIIDGGFGFEDRTFDVTPFTIVPVPVRVVPFEVGGALSVDPLVTGPSRVIEFLPYSRSRRAPPLAMESILSFFECDLS
jgi:hypothetical protein